MSHSRHSHHSHHSYDWVGSLVLLAIVVTIVALWFFCRCTLLIGRTLKRYPAHRGLHVSLCIFLLLLLAGTLFSLLNQGFIVLPIAGFIQLAWCCRTVKANNARLFLPNQGKSFTEAVLRSTWWKDSPA